jgi:hypothetical protein
VKHQENLSKRTSQAWASCRSLEAGVTISRQPASLTNDEPRVSSAEAFDGVAIEHVFAEKRLYEELIVSRPSGKKYSNIEKRLSRQSLHRVDSRMYDVWVFDVTAFREQDLDFLRATFEGPNGISNPDFDRAGHAKLHQSLMRGGSRQYWFDIISFF